MSLLRFTRLQAPLRQSTRQFSAFSSRMASSGDDKEALDANKGSIGREFESDGKIGGTAQKVGGPFAADGAVGKEFTKQGSIGGKAQEAAESDSIFDKDGAVGKEFQPDGKIGQIGEKIGGPFSSDGAVGKQFTDKGAVGGTVQDTMGSKKT